MRKWRDTIESYLNGCPSGSAGTERQHERTTGPEIPGRPQGANEVKSTRSPDTVLKLESVRIVLPLSGVQNEFLKKLVADGRFLSRQEAVRYLIEERINKKGLS